MFSYLSCICIYCVLCCVFFFKQKTAYEMRISDWSSDVCSSDLQLGDGRLSGSGKPSDRHEARRHGGEQIIGEREIMQSLGREVQIRRRYGLCCQCMSPDGRADGKKQGHERYARLILRRNVQVAVQQKIRLSLKPARPKVHQEKGEGIQPRDT